jgi:hypothetical protein
VAGHFPGTIRFSSAHAADREPVLTVIGAGADAAVYVRYLSDGRVAFGRGTATRADEGPAVRVEPGHLYRFDLAADRELRNLRISLDGRDVLEVPYSGWADAPGALVLGRNAGIPSLGSHFSGAIVVEPPLAHLCAQVRDTAGLAPPAASAQGVAGSTSSS